MSKSLLRDAIRRGLNSHGTAGAVLALAAVAPAMAQDAPAANQQQLDTVTVTGSRIRKADVETAQPIVVLDRTTIDKQGFNSIADILQNLPEAGSNPLPRSYSLASGEDVGGYYVDIRNLGNNRTLVLLNGKRLGASTSGSQDLSQIPMAAIERIEILKDGASAIYGSDAIAGVVNIITRRNYEGLQFDSYLSQYDKDDGKVQTYSMTMGSHSERGSITMSAEYGKSDPVSPTRSKATAYPQGPVHPTVGWTGTSQWGRLIAPSGFCGNSASQTCTLNPGGNPFDPNDYHVTFSGGGLSDRSNAGSQQFLQTGLEHYSLFVSSEYAITDDIRFKSDLLYNRRATDQQNAGYPYQASDFGQELSVDSYYNPLGSHHAHPGYEDTSVNFVRRMWEVPRSERSTLDTFRFSAGLEGTFDIAGRSWGWDVGGYVNTNDVRKSGRGNANLYNVANALGPSFLDPATGRVTCGTPDNPLPYGASPGSCVPWNPLLPAGQGGQGSLSDPELQTYLFPQLNDIGRTKEVEYSLNLTGPVFTLPAGDVNVAGGYEYRNMNGRFIPDALKQTDGGSTDLANGPTHGGYKLDEYYVEIDVPVLKDVPFARELSVNAAARFSDYSTFGETTNPKFSLTWRPIDDLLVRANLAKGFRAPSISELYGGVGGTFPDYTDPCDTRGNRYAQNADLRARCVNGFAGRNPASPNFVQPRQGYEDCPGGNCQSPVPTLNGSDPGLQPETALSRTLGVVYSPGWLQGLDLSLDWYRVRIKNALTADSLTATLEDCYVRGIASRCQFFQRAPAGVAPDPRYNGFVNQAVTPRTRNAGWVETQGYDIGIKYRLPEFGFGRFTVDWNTNYVDYLNTKADDEASTVPSPSTSFIDAPRIRSVASLDWSLGDFGATWTTRYWSSMKENCVATYPDECNMPDYVAPDTGPNPLRRVGANTFHDASFRWMAPWNASVTIGVNNVFAHVPSVYYSKLQFFFGTYGDFDIDRTYYLRYTQKF